MHWAFSPIGRIFRIPSIVYFTMALVEVLHFILKISLTEFLFPDSNSICLRRGCRSRGGKPARSIPSIPASGGIGDCQEASKRHSAAANLC